jgi:hypothetical protein
MDRRVVTFNPNSSISPIEPNTQWKDDVRNNSTTDDEYRNARIERRDEYDNNTFNKYGNFGDGYGTQTWVNTNENKNDSSLDHLDPFFYPHHDSTERDLLRNHNLTSSTGASRNDWRKFSDVGRGKTLDWSEVGEENNDSSDSRRNCNGNGNGESCTISGGKRTRRKKYRKVRQIKRKTKRHRKTKYNKKKYSKRR